MDRLIHLKRNRNSLKTVRMYRTDKGAYKVEVEIPEKTTCVLHHSKHAAKTAYDLA